MTNKTAQDDLPPLTEPALDEDAPRVALPADAPAPMIEPVLDQDTSDPTPPADASVNKTELALDKDAPSAVSPADAPAQKVEPVLSQDTPRPTPPADASVNKTEPVLGKAVPSATQPADALVKKAEPVLEGDMPTDADATRLVLPVEITHAQAAGCLHLLLSAAQAKKRDQSAIVIDAGPLARFDSSALTVLLECRRKMLQAGRRFAVRDMPARLAELARLYGVAELLNLDPAADTTPAAA